MPRARDIGWQHGKMIGGHRHHVQCNYCHRTMIGGVTRFKKHLASKRGEIKGCEAVPKEVRDFIRKHLAAGKARKATQKKQKRGNVEALSGPSSDDNDSESDESDREMAAARLESLRTLHEAEVARQQMTHDNQPLMVGSREFFNAISVVQRGTEEGSAPPRATDLGWAHGLMVNGDRQKIQCRYCHKVILGGGISRLKQHLAGERGNIAPCEKVLEDVKAQMQQHLGFKILERLKKQKEPETRKSRSQGREDGSIDDVQRDVKVVVSTRSNSRRRVKREGEDAGSGRRKRQKKEVTAIVVQPQHHLVFASQEILDHADMAVAKFMYNAGIPFSAANLSHFQLMADAIAAAGPGYKMPSYQSLRGKLLNNGVEEVGEVCQELRRSWEVTGCSVIADRWTDKMGRTVINFFVYCSKGTIFVKSVDASEISKSSEALMVVFDSVVQEVDPKNIVHFLTDTTPNYKTAGKMLMSKYKTFFWSACASHCIDLMLGEFEKLNEVKEVLVKAKKICQFIYNHGWVLGLMRKKTGGRDIVRPAITRSVTNFLTLQTIVSLKEALHQMFTSTTWMQSTFSKEREGIEVTGIVVDPQFWSLCGKICKVAKPLLSVLQVADSEERPSVAYIYDAMEKAKRGIIMGCNNKESDFLPYLKVIDQIWEEELHSPLHAAAYYLNPSIFYNPSFLTNKMVQKGLLDCIEALEPNLIAQDMITRHMAFYEGSVGDFSRPVALRGRELLSPATWWSLYATDYPDLQRFAVRILTQTCSGTRCDRNLNMFERTQLKKNNRLEHDRLNDVIFIHNNLRLGERQSTVRQAQVRDPICLEEIDVDVGDWVENLRALDREDFGWINVALPITKVEYPTMYNAEGVSDSSINTNDGHEFAD